MYSCMNTADAEPDEEEDGEDGEDYNKVTALQCTALHPFMTASMYSLYLPIFVMHKDIIYPGPYGRRRRRRIPPVKSLWEYDQANQSSYLNVSLKSNRHYMFTYIHTVT